GQHRLRELTTETDRLRVVVVPPAAVGSSFSEPVHHPAILLVVVILVSTPTEQACIVDALQQDECAHLVATSQPVQFLGCHCSGVFASQEGERNQYFGGDLVAPDLVR